MKNKSKTCRHVKLETIEFKKRNIEYNRTGTTLPGWAEFEF